jgi:hypothetical protein
MLVDMDEFFNLDKPVPIRPASPPEKVLPADLPPDWHIAWDERAAIMEYDGGLPRERAEALALTAIVEEMRLGEQQHDDHGRHPGG